MKSFSVHYRFSQHFDFPARKAYDWCTNYDPGDIELGGGKGRRKIQWLNESALILTDTYFAGRRNIVKRRLIKLYPGILWWTNTRVSADGKYSQFLYQITPEPGGSRLLFIGNQIFAGSASASRRAALARQLAKEDSAFWKVLAKAMAKDLGGKRSK